MTSGSWPRWGSCPCIEVLPFWRGSSGSTAPLCRSSSGVLVGVGISVPNKMFRPVPLLLQPDWGAQLFSGGGFRKAGDAGSRVGKSGGVNEASAVAVRGRIAVECGLVGAERQDERSQVAAGAERDGAQDATAFGAPAFRPGEAGGRAVTCRATPRNQAGRPAAPGCEEAQPPNSRPAPCITMKLA